MKKLGLLILTALISTHLFGQNFDNLMTKRQIDCSDVSYNSSFLFIRFLEEDKLDSAKHLIKYWETKCGLREPTFRAKILLSLKQNNYNDSLLTAGSLHFILAYQNRVKMIKDSNYRSYDDYKSYYSFIPLGQEFDKYTQSLAKKLKNNYSSETLEYLFADFYETGSDEIFYKIQSKAFGESSLTKEYDETVKKYLDMGETHISFITGVWIPTGQLKKLGVHPEVGFQLGGKRKKMNYDLTMSLKFLNSPNYYQAKRTKSSSPESTRHFFGGYIGFDVGRDIFFKNGHEFQLTGGIGFDGFDTFRENEDKDLKAGSVFSYNFNIGFGYRYYITNSFYLGLRPKYNIVDYSLNKKIDFTGNPITIQFTVGGVENVFRNHNLKVLKYKLRK